MFSSILCARGRHLYISGEGQFHKIIKLLTQQLFAGFSATVPNYENCPLIGWEMEVNLNDCIKHVEHSK